MRYLTLFAALCLVSCYKTEYSGTLSERGRVIDCFYTAAQVTHTSTTTVIQNGNSYIGSSYRGDYQRLRNSISTPSVYYNDAVNEIPAKYGVMFECEHNVKFVIEGSDDDHKKLWQKMKKDSTITIFYREVYHVDTKTGQKSLYDYDFLDAQLEDSTMMESPIR